MFKYFCRYASMGSLLVGLCLISSSLYGREDGPEGREEIAQGDFHTHYNNTRHPVRMGDWDYHENWQYNRKAFYSGETQPESYRKDHPYGPSGIGYDADQEYLDFLKERRRDRIRDRYSHHDHIAEQETNGNR